MISLRASQTPAILAKTAHGGRLGVPDVNGYFDSKMAMDMVLVSPLLGLILALVLVAPRRRPPDRTAR